MSKSTFGTLQTISIGGAVSAASYAALCALSLRHERMPFTVFAGLLGIAAAAYLWTYLRLPKQLTKSLCRAIAVWAVLFRLFGLLGAPIYEDDYYRYLWDGRSFALTGDPYAKPPSASFGDDAVAAPFDDILSRINYPDIPTIYGPVSEVSFLVSYWLAPGSLRPLQILYVVIDLATLWLLWKIVPGGSGVFLYAWSPLLIKEVAFTPHTDILAAFFMVAAILFATGITTIKGVLSGIMIGMAVAARVTAGVVMPAIYRLRVVPWLAAAITLVSLYGPFLTHGHTDSVGLGAFAAEWEYNSFVYAVIRSLGGRTAAAIGSLLLYAAFLLGIVMWKREWLRADILLAVFFLLAPVVNPWYLVPLVPLVALRPTAWGVGATLGVLVSYATGMNLNWAGIGRFDHPWWVRPLELLIVAGFAFAGGSLDDEPPATRRTV